MKIKSSLSLFPILPILLASTALAETTIIQLNDSLAGGNVGNFQLATSGSLVTYQGDLTTDNTTELYSASTKATGTQLRLNNTPTLGGGVSVTYITPDSSRAIYRGLLTSGEAATALYSASTGTAGTQIKLSSSAFADGYVLNVALTADSSRAVYIGALTTSADIYEIYSASTTAAGTQIRLNNTPVAGGSVSASTTPLLTTDGSRVIYTGDLSTDNVNELYAASTTAAGTQIKLNNTPVSGGSVFGALLAAGNNRAIYYGDLTTDNVFEVYSASVTAAGTQIKISSTPVSGGGVSSIAVTANGARAIYYGDMTTDNVVEVYGASTTAMDTQIKLSNTPVLNGDVLSTALTADSNRVVYRGDLTTDTVNELYAASTIVAGTQITLNNTPVLNGDVNSYALSANSSRVVFLGDLTTDTVNELYSASTGTAGTQVRLTNLAGSNDVLTYLISGDSTFVIYEQTDGTSESLWKVDIFGLSAAVRLTDPTAYAFNVNSYAITADNQNVIFSGDYTTDNVVNLYSIAIVPEPSTYAMLFAGGGILLYVRLRRTRAKATA